MRITELVWDEWNVEHISAHGVKPEEVEEACGDPDHWVIRDRVTRYGLARYRLYGQTEGGRYLFVVLDREDDDAFYVVTAREMTDAEKSRFRKGLRR